MLQLFYSITAFDVHKHTKENILLKDPDLMYYMKYSEHPFLLDLHHG